ncbi:MAG: peptidylprolyl isomerase [Pseudonocardiaceae bacterium]
MKGTWIRDRALAVKRLAWGGARARIITTVLVALAMLAVAIPVGIAKVTGLPDDAAFRVGDVVVTESALEHRIKVLRALYGIQEPTEGARRDKFRRDAAKTAVVSVVIDAAAGERKIVVPEKAARDALGKMIEQQYGSGGRERFVAELAAQGASESDVLAELARQQRIDRLFAEVTADAAAAVDGSAVRAYYDGHPREMTTPEQRRLRNIVVRERAQARKVAKLARSSSFATVAKRHSLDQSTRKKGGDLGLVRRDMLEDAYARAAFAAAPGKVFGPVKTAHGWNVGQVTDVRPPRKLPYTEVAASLKESLKNEKAVNEWRDWLTALLKRSDVEYADEFRPAAPLAPPPVPRRPALGGGPSAEDGPR